MADDEQPGPDLRRSRLREAGGFALRTAWVPVGLVVSGTVAVVTALPFGAVTVSDTVTWPVDGGAPIAQTSVFFSVVGVLLFAIAWLSRRQVLGLVRVRRVVPLWTALPLAALPVTAAAVATTDLLGGAVALLVTGALLPSWWLVLADGSSLPRVVARLAAGAVILTPPYVSVLALALPPIFLLHVLTPRNYSMLLAFYALPTAGFVTSHVVATTAVAVLSPRVRE